MRNITSYPLDVPYHTSAAATDPAHSLRVPQPTLRFERVLLSLLFLTFMYTYRYTYLTWYDIHRLVLEQAIHFSTLRNYSIRVACLCNHFDRIKHG